MKHKKTCRDEHVMTPPFGFQSKGREQGSREKQGEGPLLPKSQHFKSDLMSVLTIHDLIVSQY
jgi:hypothetical protein